MSLSMYDVSVSMMIGTLEAMSAFIDKGAAHAEQRKIDPEALLTARLFPDMFSFTRQVQLATDFAKGAGARLAGVDIPKYDDSEKSFSELKMRIAKTIAFLQSLDRKAIDDSADRTVTLQIRGQEQSYSGKDFLLTRALPNFFFHVTTAYNLLRHNGVDIGKSDFIARA